MKKLLIVLTLFAAFTGGVIWVGTRPWPVADASAPGLTPLPTPETCFADTITPTALLTLTNAQRSKAGLAPLALNIQLNAAATMKGQDMVTKHYWSHNSPDGLTPWYWLRSAGYPYQYAGENLAERYNTAQAVITGWMNSPGHRANVLNSHYTDVGFASICGTTTFLTTVTVAEYGSQ